MEIAIRKLSELTEIKTGKLDANAASADGKFPFFTCATTALRIDVFAFDCEAVLVAGNGDLNVKYYEGRFNAYQRTYVIQSKNKSILDVKYLYYFLDSYLETLREMSIGGVIKYIKLPYLNDAQIPLPSISEQRRIADELSAVKKLVDKHEFAILKLKKLMEVLKHKSFAVN